MIQNQIYSQSIGPAPKIVNTENLLPAVFNLPSVPLSMLRDKEGEERDSRQTDNDREKQRETETDGDIQRQTDRHIQIDRDNYIIIQIDIRTGRLKEIGRMSERQRYIRRHRNSDKDRKAERHKPNVETSQTVRCRYTEGKSCKWLVGNVGRQK